MKNLFDKPAVRRIVFLFSAACGVLYSVVMFSVEAYLYSFPKIPDQSLNRIVPWNFHGAIHYITPPWNEAYEIMWDVAPIVAIIFVIGVTARNANPLR
jgi:hypothetical protein